MSTPHKLESPEEGAAPDCPNWARNTLCGQCIGVAAQMEGAWKRKAVLLAWSSLLLLLPCCFSSSLQLQFSPTLIGDPKSPEPARFWAPDWDSLSTQPQGLSKQQYSASQVSQLLSLNVSWYNNNNKKCIPPANSNTLYNNEQIRAKYDCIYL